MQYDRRYASNWQEISLETRKLTGFKCCFPGCHDKATSTHHALYRDKDGPIAGREIPLVHCFGLCDYHHSDQDENCAHFPTNWYRGHELGARLDARQRVNYYRLLIQGANEKTRRYSNQRSA